MSLRQGASALVIRGSSPTGVEPAPPAGVHWSMTMPFGTYKYAIRPGAAPFCRAGAANAGNIASRNGSATVAPKPRSAARRDRFLTTPPLGSSPHPERTAVHNLDHQRSKPVIVTCALPENLIDG